MFIGNFPKSLSQIILVGIVNFSWEIGGESMTLGLPPFEDGDASRVALTPGRGQTSTVPLTFGLRSLPFAGFAGIANVC